MERQLQEHAEREPVLQQHIQVRLLFSKREPREFGGGGAPRTERQTDQPTHIAELLKMGAELISCASPWSQRSKNCWSPSGTRLISGASGLRKSGSRWCGSADKEFPPPPHTHSFLSPGTKLHLLHASVLSPSTRPFSFTPAPCTPLIQAMEEQQPGSK